MNQKYNDVEKQVILDQYLSGKSVAETNIPRSTLYSWIKAHNDKQNIGKVKDFNLTNFRLFERKVDRLEGIIKILKTVDCTATAPLGERLNALEKSYEQYNVHMMKIPIYGLRRFQLWITAWLNITLF